MVDQPKKNHIGFVGGVCLLTNSCIGPAVVTIPVLLQHSGLLVVVGLTLFVSSIAFFTAYLLIETIDVVKAERANQSSRQPTEESREHDSTELTSLVKYFFSLRAFYASVFIFNGSLLALNIGSIIATAKAIDVMFAHGFHNSYALELSPSPFTFTHERSGEFPDTKVIISTGLCAVFLIAGPLGRLNLSDNVGVQVGAVVAIMCMALIWVIDFSLHFNWQWSTLPSKRPPSFFFLVVVCCSIQNLHWIFQMSLCCLCLLYFSLLCWLVCSVWSAERANLHLRQCALHVRHCHCSTLVVCRRR